MKPLRERKILSSKELHEIFANVEMIYNIHKQFIIKFNQTTNLEELMFGQTFLKVVDFLKVYKEFCVIQEQSNIILAKLKQGNSALDEFLKVIFALFQIADVVRNNPNQDQNAESWH